MNYTDDLRGRCDKAIEIMIETGPALHVQVDRVLGVFDKLTLDESRKKNNQVMMRYFGKVNVVLKKYDIKSAEDYSKMSIEDLYTIMLTIRKMIDKLDLH